MMHVGLLPLMSQPLVICPGLNGSQFVRVSWLLPRFLQQRVGGGESEGWNGGERERERRWRGRERRNREVEKRAREGG